MAALLIQGYYTLPTSILFRVEALGSATKIVIGGRTGEIRLPGIDFTAKDHFAFDQGLLPPKGYRPKFRESVEMVGRTPWGRVFAMERGNVPSGASVRRVMLRFAVSDRSRETGNALGEAVVPVGRDWFGSVALWLQALTGQDLDLDYPHRKTTGGANGFFLWGSDDLGKAFISLGSQRMTSIVERNEGWVQLKQWRMAVRGASKGIGPPLPWELWVSATRSSRRGSWRRAVIDAGTAVEVALEQVLRKRLGERNSAIAVDTMISEIRMLGRRVAFSRKFGIHLPTDIDAALIQPRNAAVHSGAPPSASVARKALQVAHQILNALVPFR